MRQIFLTLLILIGGCASITVPPEYSHKTIKTKYFDIVTWQKITAPNNVYKIYIEGDGHAFNAHGLPTSDPTPKGTLMRELAFGDPNTNIVYLARPCQYKKNILCDKKYWTNARFSQEVIDSEYEAIKSIVGNNEVILIGFSGGGMVAGLIATTKNDIKVKKIITIAGNLDHKAWTEYHHFPSLNASMNLIDYYSKFNTIPQQHYVGNKDKVVPKEITMQFIESNKLFVVSGATHNNGWDTIFSDIWSEK